MEIRIISMLFRKHPFFTPFRSIDKDCLSSSLGITKIESYFMSYQLANVQSPKRDNEKSKAACPFGQSSSSSESIQLRYKIRVLKNKLQLQGKTLTFNTWISRIFVTFWAFPAPITDIADAEIIVSA